MYTYKVASQLHLAKEISLCQVSKARMFRSLLMPLSDREWKMLEQLDDLLQIFKEPTEMAPAQMLTLVHTIMLKVTRALEEKMVTFQKFGERQQLTNGDIITASPSKETFKSHRSWIRESK